MVSPVDIGLLSTVHLNNYVPILIFIIVSFGIASFLTIIPFFLAKSNVYKGKVAQYECGFDPFLKDCGSFDIKFYLVSILFIIFDLEIAFMFPWAVAFRVIGEFGFYSMLFFLSVLTIGFIYEWKSGALEWE